MNIDWLKTKQMWTKKFHNLNEQEVLNIPFEERGLIYNTNEHTNRYTFKFHWDKSTVRLPNKSFYTFDVLRDFNRDLAKALKTDSQLQYTYFE